MANDRPAHFDDISRFEAVATLLEGTGPQSLRSIASRLGVTLPTLKASIGRLEERLGGVKLVHSSEKLASANVLTAEGLQYLHAVRRFLTWQPAGRREVRLALSHTLLTSQLLTRALAAFHDHNDFRFVLRASVEMDFGGIVRDLQTDQLDLAVTWSTRGREGNKYPGVARQPLGPSFDVVLVSHRASEVRRPVSEIHPLLAGKRVVAMRPENQPLEEWLPQPNAALGGQRIQVDTIDAVLAYVRARVGDFGLVVANYGVLEPLEQLGELHVSEPVGQANLLAFSGRRAAPAARELVRLLDEQLASTPGRPPRRGSGAGQIFPADPAFYERFAFGYYIDEPREGDIPGDTQALRWKWEEVQVRRAAGTIRDAFEGRVRNSTGREFELQARLVGRQLLHVHAVQRVSEKGAAPDVEFISVFSWCQHTDDNAYLCGQWTGTRVGGCPSVYAAIWSWHQLTLAEVREIAHRVRIRTVLDVEDGLRFDKQPPNRTLTSSG